MTDDLLDADVTNVRMIARSTARIRPPAHGTIESERSLAKITLVTGGGDKPYALGLAECLAGGSMTVDFIGSDAHEVPDILEAEHVNFLNFRGSQDASVSPVRKFLRVLWYYARLIRYSAGTDSRLFHVLWANRFLLLDRVLLMAFWERRSPLPRTT